MDSSYLLAERARVLQHASLNASTSSWCVNGLRGAPFSPDWLTCCERQCGVCGGPGCGKRPGGPAACCSPGIAKRLGTARRWCDRRTDVPCLIRNLNGYSSACVRGSDGHRCLPCMRGLVSRNGSECCDASCGVCDDGDETAQCSARPGGASSCCPGVITRVGRVCKSSRHTSCRFPNHHIGPATLIGWGTYARNCGEVDALARACIGCHGNNVRSVALVDESPFTAAGEEATFSCEGSTLAFRTDVVVGGHGGGGGGVGQRVWNFDKARMIFRLLLAHASEAAWFVKIDTDAFFNVERLRVALLMRINFFHPRPPDYFGRPLSHYALDGKRFVFMQGGAYILSNRAARVVADCELGALRKCPNRHLSDVANPAMAATMAKSCLVPQTDGHDDVYSGVCIHKAGLEPSEHECMLTLFGGVNARGGLDEQDSSDGLKTWRKIRLVLRRKCRCPITAHPFKQAALLARMRNFSESSGCGRGGLGTKQVGGVGVG